MRKRGDLVGIWNDKARVTGCHENPSVCHESPRSASLPGRSTPEVEFAAVGSKTSSGNSCQGRGYCRVTSPCGRTVMQVNWLVALWSFGRCMAPRSAVCCGPYTSCCCEVAKPRYECPREPPAKGCSAIWSHVWCDYFISPNLMSRKSCQLAWRAIAARRLPIRGDRALPKHRRPEGSKMGSAIYATSARPRQR